ncbi:MAG: ERF family protein [Streptococcaceae bacterium]|jgi:hypothetical protein|nr:ERF family protein [Streptococcaceae bacterium]
MEELVKKLIEVQNRLRAPKGQYNSFGKYAYRSAEDILTAVKPLLAEQGLLLTVSDDISNVDGWKYVMAIAVITDGKHELQVRGFAREPESKKGMDSSQITGTASSYARKYALNGLFLIDDTKDADTDEYRNQTAGKQQEQPKKSKQQIMLDYIETHSKQNEEVLSLIVKAEQALNKEYKQFDEKELVGLYGRARKIVEA